MLATQGKLSKKAKPIDQAAKVDQENTERAAKIKAAGKSRAKPDDQVTNVLNPLDGVEVIDERDVPYDQIVRSPHNPRQTFDETLIAEMRPNIVTICQMSPLTIREGTNELIDGETRHRAAAGAPGVTHLRCKIVRCNDEQAALIRLQTSMQRRDLNPIEKALALQAMIDGYGLSLRQLAPIVKMQNGSISNLTRLLKLPEEWRKRVISGEITGTAARELVPWVDEPAVLRLVETNIKSLTVDEKSLALAEIVQDAAEECSRPLKGYYYDHEKSRQYQVTINPSDQEREQLRIKSVKIHGKDIERAFNLELWEELQERSEEERIAAMERRDARHEKTAKVDPNKAAELAEKKAKAFQRALYRYRCEWLQAQLIDSVETASAGLMFNYLIWFATCDDWSERRSKEFGDYAKRGEDDDNLKVLLKDELDPDFNRIRDRLVEWFALPFESYRSPIKPECLEVLAAHVGIDLKSQWPSTCKSDPSWLERYLNLLNKDQLGMLVAEWKMGTGVIYEKRSATIASIMQQNGIGKPVPKALLDVKPISLL
jgi:ParB family transcriptional regulator, chromosome partitioning protein